MSKRQKLKTSYYMVRLSGGEWSPKAKHETLAEAIQEASRLAKEHNKPATILSSYIRIESVDDLIQMQEVNPQK